MEDLRIGSTLYKFIPITEMEKLTNESLSKSDYQMIGGYDWKNYLVSYENYLIFPRLLSKEDVQYRGYYTLNN